MPTHRSNGLPETHENVGGLDWRWHAVECPSRCEERYIVDHIDELGKTWKKNPTQIRFLDARRTGSFWVDRIYRLGAGNLKRAQIKTIYNFQSEDIFLPKRKLYS